MTIEVLLWGAVLLPALAALTWIDARTFRLPDALTLPLIGVGLIQSWYLSGRLLDGLIGACAGYLFFLAVEKGFRALRGIDGLGRGDAKMLAAGGAWCGWMELPWIVLVASGTGLVFAGLMTLTGRRPGGMIAFGPFLALGIAAVWLKPFLTDFF